jgi:hypothetical protein
LSDSPPRHRLLGLLGLADGAVEKAAAAAKADPPQPLDRRDALDAIVGIRHQLACLETQLASAGGGELTIGGTAARGKPVQQKDPELTVRVPGKAP